MRADRRRPRAVDSPRADDLRRTRSVVRHPACVVLEVGTHLPWLSRLLAARGHELPVANAHQLRLIYASPRAMGATRGWTALPDGPALTQQGYTQVKSIDVLTPLAMPLPCPIYRKRKPMVLGVETNPKFTKASPDVSTRRVMRWTQAPVPLSHSALGAGTPCSEQYWNTTAPRWAGSSEPSSTCALRTNSSPTGRLETGWPLFVRKESSYEPGTGWASGLRSWRASGVAPGVTGDWSEHAINAAGAKTATMRLVRLGRAMCDLREAL